MAGREAVQHADSDARWRPGHRDSGLNLGFETHQCAHLSDCDSASVPLMSEGMLVRRMHHGHRVHHVVRVKVRSFANEKTS